jgi:hypothetical protein
VTGHPVIWARPAGEGAGAAWRRRALIPALIALTSMLGAVGAWRAEAASGAAGADERKAFADTVAAEQQREAIQSVLGSIEFTYARRQALQSAAAALYTEAGRAADDAEAARLEALAGAYQATADAFVIDADALGPDGALDLEAKRQVEWALAASTQDLDPQPELAAAQDLRTKSERLVLLTAFLIAAALFLTLAEVSRNPGVAILYWHGGAAVLTVSAVLLLVVVLL